MKGDIVGYTGTGLLAITLLPQVLKTFKNKRAGDISWTYLVLQIMSNICFILYGILIRSIPIMASTCIVCVSSLMLVYAKMRFRHDYAEIDTLLSV